ncbi:MAG: hypothetical protein R2707_01210 [Acidimicrobiales bacterium]
MATVTPGADTPSPASRPILTVVAALAVLGALAGLWLMVAFDRTTEVDNEQRFVVGTVTVEIDDATVTVLGAVPSDEFARALVDSLADRADVVSVIDRLTIDASVPTPPIGAFHTGIDALRRPSD